MKRRKSVLLALVLGMVMAWPVSSAIQNSHNRKTTIKNFVGYISDSQCGLKHMEGMESDRACVLMCVENGKFVLADRDHNKVYQLDKVGQDKAREFAGQKVKIAGRITGKTIRVVAMDAA